MRKSRLVWYSNSVWACGREWYFCTRTFCKNTPLCNYGGVQLTSNYAEKHLLPFEAKHDYVLKLCGMTDNRIKHIYLICNPTGSKTYGQLLNHSSLHPNAITKIYATYKIKLDVIFVAQCDIRVMKK